MKIKQTFGWVSYVGKIQQDLPAGSVSEFCVTTGHDFLRKYFDRIRVDESQCCLFCNTW